jgi:hypothetical protein
VSPFGSTGAGFVAALPQVREHLVPGRRLRLADRGEHGVDLSLERAHGGPHPLLELVLFARVALGDEPGDQPDDHHDTQDAEDHQPELALGDQALLDRLIDGLGPAGDGLRTPPLALAFDRHARST